MKTGVLVGVAALAAGVIVTVFVLRSRKRSGANFADAYDACHDEDGCYMPPRPDEDECLVIGKGHPRYKFGAYRVCLTPNQEKTLFQNKRKQQKKLGCGVFACAYTTPTKTRVVKFTRDTEDVAALLKAQKTGVVPMVHEVYQLQHGGHALATDEETPVYALVVERLKVFSPRDRQRLDEEILGVTQDVVAEAQQCGRQVDPGGPSRTLTACREERIATACEDYSCSPLALGVIHATLKLHDIGIKWNDVHAGNIGLDSKGRVKVLDLGVTGTKLEKPVKLLKGARFQRRLA